MELIPPQERTCQTCRKIYTLNLYRLDSHSCRYCEDGLIAPIILSSYISENQEIATKAVNNISESNWTENHVEEIAPDYMPDK